MMSVSAAPSSSLSIKARLRGSAGLLSLDLALNLSSSWTVLFGPSGAGKSTVLRALCGLLKLPEQRVILQGVDLTHVSSYRRRFAIISQDTALFPHMTAFDNVLFSVRMRGGLRRNERATEARGLLERFQASDAAGKVPSTLSGGEQQRVALARAVGSSPKLLLLDEAFTGLQANLRADLVTEVKQWQRDSGVPVISVTHDVAEAFACADEVVRIADGRVVTQGRPADVLADERSALLRQLA